MKAKSLVKTVKIGNTSITLSDKSSKVKKTKRLTSKKGKTAATKAQDTPLESKKTKKIGTGLKKALAAAAAKAKNTPKLIPHALESSKVKQGVAELLKIVGEWSKAKSELFDSEGQPIFLVLSCFRIANIPKRIVRIALPHPTLQETSDVVLIVRDLEPRKRRPDNELVVDLYERRIFAHGIKHPIKVLPIRQVMTEYNTYEAKKQLCNQFDVFLADAHISNRLTPILGKAFSKKRKNPIPVKIEAKQMKQSIEKALTKSSLKLSANGGTFTIQVGHTEQDAHHIAENIVCVAEELNKCFPGGWPNIQNLIVKTARSPGIPLYVSISNPNDIQLVVSRPTLRHGATVEGELSTDLDTKVRVHPGGRVFKIRGVEKEEKRIARVLARKQKKLDKKAMRKAAKKEQHRNSSDEDEDMSDEDLATDDDEVSDLEMETDDGSTARVASDIKPIESYESGSEDPEADEAEKAYLSQLSHTKNQNKVKKSSGKQQKLKAKKQSM